MGNGYSVAPWLGRCGYGVWSEQELGRGGESDSCIELVQSLTEGREWKRVGHAASPVLRGFTVFDVSDDCWSRCWTGPSCLTGRLLRRAGPEMVSDAGDTEVLLQPGFWIHALVLE